MSFILEALKKSEQQRQAKNTLQQKVSRRTLSLTSSQPGRPYWRLVGLPLLAILCGWWFYLDSGSLPEDPLVMSAVVNLPPAVVPLTQPKPVVTVSAVVDHPQQAVVVVESAPVPKVNAPALVESSNRLPVSRKESAVEPQRLAGSATTDMIKNAKPVATVVIEQSQPPAFSKTPRYSDLSSELRSWIPPLAMSMHFYNSDPDRRLVRINELLLHEGDWVSKELELLEITPTGVILDYLGKTFELSGSKR